MLADPGFGTHIREAVALIKAWIKPTPSLICARCKTPLQFAALDAINAVPNLEDQGYELWCSYSCPLDGLSWRERQERNAR